MKSVLYSLLGLVVSEECISTENAEVAILCDGDTCFVECLNFDLIPPGPSQIECDLETGTPKIPFPDKCVRSKCPDINGENLVSNCNANNDQCELSCTRGFLIGPSVLHCNQPSDGTTLPRWSDEIPICGESTQATCPDISISDGYVDCTAENDYKSVCQISCEGGIDLIGESSIECVYKDKKLDWSSTPAYCDSGDPIVPIDTYDNENGDEVQTFTDPPITRDPAPGASECENAKSFWTIVKCNPMVVGIGVGVFFFILLIAVGVACCIRKRKQQEEQKNELNPLWETNPTIQRSLRGSSRGEGSAQDAIVHNRTNIFRENNISEPSGSFYRPNRQAAQYPARYNQSPKAQTNPYSQVQLNPESEPFIFDPSNEPENSGYPASRGLTKNQNYQAYQSGRQPSTSNNLSTFFVPNS